MQLIGTGAIRPRDPHAAAEGPNYWRDQVEAEPASLTYDEVPSVTRRPRDDRGRFLPAA